MSRTGYKVANDRNRYEVLALETERLRLSVLRKSEASRVNSYFVKNRDFHKKYSQTHTEDYFTVSMQRKYLAYDYNSFLDGTLVPLWITLKETGEIIGRVSFFNFAFGGMMSCACGYHLDKEEPCFCAGRYYLVMRARPGSAPMSPREIRLGGPLFNSPSGQLIPYLIRRRDVLHAQLQGLITAGVPDRNLIIQVHEDISFYEAFIQERMKCHDSAGSVQSD